MKQFYLITILFILLTSICHASEVTLKWQPNDEPSLAGYRVYYGLLAASGTGNEVSNPAVISYFSEMVDVGNVVQYRITNLDKGMYNFALTAYDLDGNESEFSYVILVSLDIAKVTGVIIEEK